MNVQNNIESILKNNPLIPVVTLNNAEQTKDTLATLKAKNISCIEITLRTEKAFDCISFAKKIVGNEFSIGVGTITNADQIEQCKALNVDFMVSPGSSTILVQKMQDTGIPYLPGVMTPSEIMQMMALNCKFLKLFPYNLAGSNTALKTYQGLFPGIKFCPTGGIGNKNFNEVLKMKNVISVGGSWLAK